MNRTGHKGRTETLTPARIAFYVRHQAGLKAMVGEKFGRWTVEAIGDRIGGMRFMHCRCECGSKRQVSAKTLRNGESSSCGCWRRDDCIARSTKHGRHNTPEYIAWSGMKERCLNPQAHNYRWYGGAGVSVCDQWRDSFSAFLADMGPKPGSEYTIEREDPFGNYEPGNCRWDTWEVQHRNTRKARDDARA